MKTLVKIVVSHELVVEVDPEQTPPKEFHEKIHHKVDSLTDPEAVKAFFGEMGVNVAELKVGIHMSDADPLQMLLEALKEKIMNDENAPDEIKQLIQNIDKAEDINDIDIDGVHSGMISARSPEELAQKMRAKGFPEDVVREVVEEVDEDNSAGFHPIH